MVLTETVLLYIFPGIWTWNSSVVFFVAALDKFLFLGDFQKIILFKRSGILEDIYLFVLFVRRNQVNFLVYGHDSIRISFGYLYKFVMFYFLLLFFRKAENNRLANIG